jgi:hypothetical protein
MGQLNEKYHLKHKDPPLDDMMADFQASYKQIISVIERVPEEEMLKPGVYA